MSKNATDSPFWLAKQGCGCLVVIFVVLAALLFIVSMGSGI
jgi:hypothetical protein